MMIGMRGMMTLGSVLSSPVVVDGIVYFGSTDGHLYAVR
jgi:outer membrane protein assembly factor BamB